MCGSERIFGMLTGATPCPPTDAAADPRGLVCARPSAHPAAPGGGPARFTTQHTTATPARLRCSPISFRYPTPLLYPPSPSLSLSPPAPPSPSLSPPFSPSPPPSSLPSPPPPPSLLPPSLPLPPSAHHHPVEGDAQVRRLVRRRPRVRVAARVCACARLCAGEYEWLWCGGA